MALALVGAPSRARPLAVALHTPPVGAPARARPQGVALHRPPVGAPSRARPQGVALHGREAAPTGKTMTKSELIDLIAAKQTQLSVKDVELAVKTIIEQMAETLAAGERIEIRGFGSFSLHYRAPRIGRNPKTGESVGLAGKYVPHFKPGKELRDRVNAGLVGERDEVEPLPRAAEQER